MSKHFLDITFSNQTQQKIDEDEIRSHIEQLVSRLSQHKSFSNLEISLQSPGATGRLSIEIVFVGDQEIKRLNKRYRGKNSATDVLSFEKGDDANMPSVSANPIGSVVVSVDTATIQAKEAGNPLITELKMLAGHGTLHLFGFHHN